MIKRRKIGILLILIGISIPLVLFFFEVDGEIKLANPTYKEVERKLTTQEIKIVGEMMARLRKTMEKYGIEKELLKKWSLLIDQSELEQIYGEGNKKEKWTIRYKLILMMPYNYSIGIGIIIVFIGIGMIIFSFFPKEEKSKKEEEKEGE